MPSGRTATGAGTGVALGQREGGRVSRVRLWKDEALCAARVTGHGHQ
jgi:hypothetical protein